MKHMNHGLAIVIGGKPKEKAEPEEDDGGEEREYASVAFDALKDDDKEAFTDALIGAVKACVKKAMKDDYAEE